MKTSFSTECLGLAANVAGALAAVRHAAGLLVFFMFFAKKHPKKLKNNK
jgi:hypothetical protein